MSLTAAQSLPPVTGNEAYVGAIVVAGASQAAGAFMVAPVNKREGIVPYGLAVNGNTLTRAMCNSDLLVSTASGGTGLFVPTLAAITDIAGYTYVFGALELGFRIERRGIGALLLTFDVAGGVVVEDPFGLINPTDGSLRQYVPMSVALVGPDHWRVG